MRWLLRHRRPGSNALDLVLVQTLFIAAVLSVLSLSVDWVTGGGHLTDVLVNKAVIAAGFFASAVLAYRRWRQVALYASLTVTISALAHSALGFGASPSGYFQLWAILIVPFIGVVGTLGEVRFGVAAGLAAVASSQWVMHAWGLTTREQVLGFFVVALGSAVAVAMAVVLNESKRQTLHDQRAAKRVSRRLAVSQQRQAQAERLAMLGQLAATMAHEINNPLAFTMANLRFVAGSLPGDTADLEELQQALSESQDGLERIRAIVERMKTFRAPARPVEKTADPSLALDRIVDNLGLPSSSRARLLLQHERTLPAIELDELRLGRVVGAVITNALEAVAASPKAELAQVRLSSAVEKGRLVLIVEDDGPGIAPEVLSQLFEPFVTTAGSGKLGLSLALARELARSAGGDLRAANRAEGGARFTAEFPVAS